MTRAEAAVLRQANSQDDSPQRMIARATLQVLQVKCDHRENNSPAIGRAGFCNICGICVDGCTHQTKAGHTALVYDGSRINMQQCSICGAWL